MPHSTLPLTFFLRLEPPKCQNVSSGDAAKPRRQPGRLTRCGTCRSDWMTLAFYDFGDVFLPQRGFRRTADASVGVSHKRTHKVGYEGTKIAQFLTEIYADDIIFFW